MRGFPAFTPYVQEATELIAAGELRNLAGVGKTIAARIEELATTGHCAYFDELAGRYPPTLIELLGETQRSESEGQQKQAGPETKQTSSSCYRFVMSP